jgi:hypothetical protein
MFIAGRTIGIIIHFKTLVCEKMKIFLQNENTIIKLCLLFSVLFNRKNLRNRLDRTHYPLVWVFERLFFHLKIIFKKKCHKEQPNIFTFYVDCFCLFHFALVRNKPFFAFLTKIYLHLSAAS